MTDQELNDVQQAMVDTGAVNIIEAEISKLTEEALSVLDTTSLAGGAEKALRDLAHFVAFRSH